MRARLGLILAAAVLSAPFWMLGHPLWEVDDARYAEIPREMAEDGDWVTPHLNYLDYVEKPPLIYWCQASAMAAPDTAAMEAIIMAIWATARPAPTKGMPA